MNQQLSLGECQANHVAQATGPVELTWPADTVIIILGSWLILLDYVSCQQNLHASSICATSA